MKEDWIIIDTGSTTLIMSNPYMVTYINKAPNKLYPDTNGSNTKCNTKMKENYFGHGRAWFDDNFIGKIYRFSETMDK